MNQLEKWNSDGVIVLKSTEALWDETPLGSRFRAKATEASAMSGKSCNDQENDKRRSRIQAIFLGSKTPSENDEVDIKMLFVASFYPGAIVVTDDQGILGAAQELRKEFHIQVMTDSEVVALIARKIGERDLMETRSSIREDRVAADWVGKDSPE
jgi:hypothetical protein